MARKYELINDLYDQIIVDVTKRRSSVAIVLKNCLQKLQVTF